MSVSSSNRAVRRLRAGRRIAVAIAALFLLPLTFTSMAAAQDEPYKVLVFTKNATVGASEGVAAIQAAVDPAVTVDVTNDASAFTAANLAKYRAVMFLDTSGDVLDDTQQTAFENYFRAGGGFLGTGSAIETEPSWPFMTNILGTRSTTRTDATQATIKVADRGHDASKLLPEYWVRSDRWYNFPATSAASRTSSARSTRRPHRAARWAPTTRSPGARTTRAGAPSTRWRRHRRRVRRGRLPQAPRRRADVGGRRSRTRIQRLWRDRAGQLPADQDLRAAEPPRADRLRRAPRRSRHPDGARRARCACTTRRPARQGHRHPPRVHQQRGRPLRPGDRQRLRDQQVGLPLLRPADGPHPEVRRHDGRRHHADRLARRHRGGPLHLAGSGPATSSCRASSSSTARTRRWT